MLHISAVHYVRAAVAGGWRTLHTRRPQRAAKVIVETYISLQRYTERKYIYEMMEVSRAMKSPRCYPDYLGQQYSRGNNRKSRIPLLERTRVQMRYEEYCELSTEASGLLRSGLSVDETVLELMYRFLDQIEAKEELDETVRRVSCVCAHDTGLISHEGATVRCKNPARGTA